MINKLMIIIDIGQVTQCANECWLHAYLHHTAALSQRTGTAAQPLPAAQPSARGSSPCARTRAPGCSHSCSSCRHSSRGTVGSGWPTTTPRSHANLESAHVLVIVRALSAYDCTTYYYRMLLYGTNNQSHTAHPHPWKAQHLPTCTDDTLFWTISEATCASSIAAEVSNEKLTRSCCRTVCCHPYL